jgi:hypothetical protein
VLTETLPRLDEPYSGTRVEAVRWNQSGSNALGFGLGVTLAPGIAVYDPRPRLHPGFGLRWRSTLGDGQRLDVATWRNLQARAINGSPDTEPAPIVTHIELQFSPAKAYPFGAELGAVGLRLSSEANLQLRIKRGGPMIYYRSKF